MAKGRPRKTSGAVFRRPHSAFWWVRYRNRGGQIVKESAGTTDEQEAQRFLRKRLDARDDGQLPTVLAARNLTFGEWGDWFLEVRSKPPFRAAGTHRQNLNAVARPRPVFGNTRLSDITSTAIEQYLADRVSCGRCFSYQARSPVLRQAQTCNRAPGVQNLKANAQRGCQAEAVGNESMHCRRISGSDQQDDLSLANS